MTYLQILNTIKDIALAQPNVNSVVREFLDLNREDAKYSAVVIQDRDGSRDRIVEQDYITYTWHLGYVDRLVYDESNRDDIISTGINIINNIVNTIRNTWFPELEVSVIDRINTFDQRFTAQCAGVYVVLAVNAQVSDCIDSESTDIYDKFEVNITENGAYHFVPSGRPVDDIDIVVNVESQYKPEDSLIETITSNGSYSYTPEEGRVFSDVSIAVDVHPTESLSRTYTSNGNYDITGEFNGGTVNVDVHPSQSLVETITSNGSYSYPGEYTGVDITVDVPSDQKTEDSLVETITSNSSYSYKPEEGSVFNEVDITVAVPVPKISSLITMPVKVNGVQRWGAAPGEAWDFAEVTVDVHPSVSLSETYTSNGSYDITGEFNGGVVTVSVSAEKPEESLVESISSNGSYHYDPTAGSVFSDVNIAVDVHPSSSLSETITSNGSYSYPGEYAGAEITVSVSAEKPEESLEKTITSNGSYSYTPEEGSVFSDVSIAVDVHPSNSLSKKYTSNGSYNISGEFNGGVVTVAVPTTVTVTMTQDQYNALSVKDSNTIYLIKG